jgi:hypothetical protein
MSGMITRNETTESQANRLCKACGLCCTGHLFIWTKLRAAELSSIEALGVKVLRSVPRQRGFNQPCPLWQGQCTIYETEQYPRFCRTYKCKLLKQLLDESTSLPHALTVINQVKEQIHEIEALLPASSDPNFRERLVCQLEILDDSSFRQKAGSLLRMYEEVFGVVDVIE